MYFAHQLRKSTCIIQKALTGCLLKRDASTLIKTLQNYKYCIGNSELHVFNYMPLRLNRIYKMPYVDLDFYMDIIDKAHPCDNYIREIRSTDCIIDAIELIERNLDNLSYQHCCEFIFQIFRLKRRDWASERSSFKESVEINTKLMDMPLFYAILAKMHDKVNELSVEEAICLKFCLNHFGVKLTTPIMNNLYLHIYPSLEQLDIHSLARLCLILVNHCGVGYPLLGKIMQRTSAIMMSCELEEEINSLALIVQHNPIVCRTFWKQYQDKVISFIERKKFNDHNVAISLINSFTKLDVTNTGYCEIVSQYLSSEISKFGPEKCIFLSVVTNDNDDMSSLDIAMADHVKTLLKECSCMEIKEKLSGCIPFYAQLGLDLNIENCTCGRYNCFSSYSNWKHIFSQLNKTPDYSLISVLYDLLRFQFRYQKYKINPVILNELIHQVKINYTSVLKHYMFDISVVTAFLLSFCDDSEKYHLYHSLYHILHNREQLNLSCILVLTGAIRRYKLYGVNEKLRPLLGAVEHSLNIQSEHLLKENKNIAKISSLLCSFANRGNHQNYHTYFGQVGIVKRLLSFMNTKSAMNLAYYCNRQVVTTEIHNSIADYTVEHQSRLSVRYILKILSCYYQYGVIPTNPNFPEACINILKKINFEVCPQRLLNAACLFNIAGQMPSQLTNHILKLSYLEKIEQLKFTNEKVYNDSMETWKMLYVSHCLQDLGKMFWMPALHNIKIGSNTAGQEVYDNLEEDLIKICGEDTVRRETISVYGHKIDFEFILDDDGQPVNIQSLDENCEIDMGKRIAVFYLTPNKYIVNKNTLIGSSILKKRQLQLLGYNIVEIYAYAWVDAWLKRSSEFYVRQLITEQVPKFKTI